MSQLKYENNTEKSKFESVATAGTSVSWEMTGELVSAANVTILGNSFADIDLVGSDVHKLVKEKKIKNGDLVHMVIDGCGLKQK